MYSHIVHSLRRWVARVRLRRVKGYGILFVCQGNLCRSPYAAGALDHLSGFGERDVDIESAGFMTEIPTPPRTAIEAAAARGIDLSAHTAQLVTRALVKNSDLIVVMEARQRHRIERIFRTKVPPVIVLGDLDPQSGHGRDISDPIQKPREAFDATFARIDRCIAVLAEHVCGVDREVSRRITNSSDNAANLQQVRHDVRRIGALPLLLQKSQTQF